MQDQESARVKRLTIWFSINLVIFILCYLNYCYQLKHRYLYRMLNIGLCLSRAAAMVINFNLLLVWLPMCKYSLTRLACLLASQALSEREHLKQLSMTDGRHQQQEPANREGGSSMIACMNSSGKQLKWSLRRAWNKFKCKILQARIKSINSFLVAVDHCTSLHTICATTITLASIIHTLAHLMNVINFSRHFDPFLGNLNMASARGQNPFQLLVSVPGITGCLMIIILLLMSLSSVQFIRNSAFDLFQIFHRLSVVFVALLIIHPSSHVLKEQSNVDYHHPELCRHRASFNGTAQSQARWPPAASEPCRQGAPTFVAQNSICWYVLSIGLSCYLLDLVLRRLRRSRSPIELIEAKTLPDPSSRTESSELIELVLSNNHKRFKIWKPGQFVYVNCPQISAYEWHPFTISSMDDGRRQFTLHIKTGGDWTRQLKSELELRSRPPEEGLLFAGARSSDNIIEFVSSAGRPDSTKAAGLKLLSFSGNLAKQKVQCQMVASSDCVDQRTGRVQVQCKRLVARHEDNCAGCCCCCCCCCCCSGSIGSSLSLGEDETAGAGNNNNNTCHIDMQPPKLELYIDGPFHSPFERLLEQQVSVCVASGVGWTAFSSVFQEIARTQPTAAATTTKTASKNLCFITAPGKKHDYKCDCWQKFAHPSLQQQQQQQQQLQGPATTFNDGHWQDNHASSGASAKQIYSSQVPTGTDDNDNNLSHNLETKLHLMVIVTTIEQLRPFYKIALNYFRCMQGGGKKTEAATKAAGRAESLADQERLDCPQTISNKLQHSGRAPKKNSIKEVTVYLTRSSKDDESVRSFCREENLSPPPMSEKAAHSDRIQVNEIFSIHFGKPNFDNYLRGFSQLYSHERKISVYCCGSYQIKRLIQDACLALNKVDDNGGRRRATKTANKPIFCYHEENF